MDHRGYIPVVPYAPHTYALDNAGIIGMSKIYGRRWDKARRLFLVEHPTCQICRRMGKLVAASVVDHVIAHKGNIDTFWDETNWNAICKKCHDSIKQSQEKTNKLLGTDINGRPMHADHPWNKQREDL